MYNEASWLEHALHEIEMYFFSYVFQSSGRFERDMAIDCRAIHLRNLVPFFYKERYGYSWHVSHFADGSSGMRLIDDEALFEDLRDYTDRATGYPARGFRLSHAYKVEAMRCYEKAFPLLLDASEDFLDSIGSTGEEERIQKLAAETRTVIGAAERCRNVLEISSCKLLY